MVRLEERPPLFKEIEVSDGGDDDVHFINQRRCDDGCRSIHGGDVVGEYGRWRRGYL
ncbi:hypothetical protein Hanom_Chr07g00591991 [Helianthus anomalus]